MPLSWLKTASMLFHKKNESNRWHAFLFNAMDVYICFIILIYGFENYIDIWIFTTLLKTVECVNNTFFGKFQFRFPLIRLNTFPYYTITEPAIYLSITVCFYHCRSMHFGAFSFSKSQSNCKMRSY